MSTSTKYFTKFAFVLGLIFTLSTCKKYPENTLWFKNPNNIGVLNGVITKYEVNGIDSLELLNKYFGSNNTIINKNIKELRFYQTFEHKQIRGYWNLGAGSCSGSTRQEYVQKCKKIKLGYSIDTLCFKKNIFVSSEQIWEILHFPTKKKPYFKIRSSVNNNLITIQLN